MNIFDLTRMMTIFRSYTNFCNIDVFSEHIFEVCFLWNMKNIYSVSI